MKTISLTQGKIALVDDIDYQNICRFKWMTHKGRHSWYACRNYTGEDGKKHTMYMHRQILGVANGVEIDHIDGNGLNNQRNNLRECSCAQNNRAFQAKRNYMGLKASSKFRGVSLYKDKELSGCIKWLASIKYNYKSISLGYFNTEIEAAHAYDKGARKYFGAFAHLNFPD